MQGKSLPFFQGKWVWSWCALPLFLNKEGVGVLVYGSVAMQARTNSQGYALFKLWLLLVA